MCHEGGEKDMSTVADVQASPKERLEQSLKELRMIKQGQLPEPTWEYMMKELERNDD